MPHTRDNETHRQKSIARSFIELELIAIRINKALQHRMLNLLIHKVLIKINI